MKTYLLSIPTQLKSFSAKLDVKGVLCGKSWEVFNDEGVKQLFIFSPDGSLLVTNNGIVFHSTWEFIPANSSIIITTEGESTMFDPAFYDDIIFALQQNGVERYLFMIDQKNKDKIPSVTLQSLKAYFEIKAKELLLQDPVYQEQLAKEKEEKEYQTFLRKQKREEARKKKEEQRIAEKEEIGLVAYLESNKDIIKQKYLRCQKIYKYVIWSMVFISVIVFLIGLLFSLPTLIALGLLLLLPVIIILNIDTSFDEYVRNSYERNNTPIRYLSKSRVKELCGRFYSKEDSNRQQE